VEGTDDRNPLALPLALALAESDFCFAFWCSPSLSDESAKALSTVDLDFSRHEEALAKGSTAGLS
jgi:hypothetical protein